MEQQVKKQRKQVLPAVFKLYGRSWRWNPGYIAMLVCRIAVKTVRPFPGIVFPAMIMDALLEGEDLDRVTGLILAMAGSIFLISAMEIWSEKKLSLLQSGFKDCLNRMISEKQLHLSLEKIESVEMRELFLKASSAVSGDLNFAVRKLGGARGADAIGDESVNLVAGVLKVIVLVLALFKLGIVPVFVIIGVLIFHMVGGNRERRASYEERMKTMPYRNKNQYVTDVMIDFQKAKEIRLYRLQDFLLDKFKANKGYFYQAREEAKSAYFFSHGLGILGEIAQTVVTYGYLIAHVLGGSMTIGEFTGYSAALNHLSVTLLSVWQAWLNIYLYGEYFIDFETAMSIEEEWEQKLPEGNAQTGTVQTGIISFQEVSFSYPGTGRKVLDRVFLEIPLKGSISIVGQNGSGKSTLVKLLLRLYRPDEGRILLDGTDIWEIPLEEYRRRIAAVFQDYSIFALDIRYNVSPDGDADEAVWKSLRKAGAEQAARKLPKQLDTPLFGYYHEDGVDLSGGEKQKIAIARMLHKDSEIMILDEPTAALDPRAELEIYEQVHSLAEGKLILYISHRMSSCHFSDSILVFEDGKVAEYGAHEELMEKKGLYYQLYSSQAECYKAGGVA